MGEVKGEGTTKNVGMSKRLILTVGLPRSGKSTWAWTQGHPIVNPDAIRFALHGQRFIAQAEPFVWATAYLMVDALFIAGHSIVIVDATNISNKRRDAWIEKFKYCTIVLQEFIVSPEECKRRALELKDTDILPIIDRMAAEYERPSQLIYLPSISTS